MRHVLLLTGFAVLATATSAPAMQRKSAGDRAAQAKRDALKGRRVLVIKSGAEIKTRENGAVWKAYLGEVLTVALVQGEWYWVFERQGWLWSRDVIPFDTAVFEMNERLQRSRKSENYLLRGVAHLAHKKYDKAIEDFSECLRQDPRLAGAYNNRGNAYFAQKKYKRARDDYSVALRLNPKHTIALNNRGIANTRMGEFDAALLDLNAALKINPEYSEALNNRGVVYKETGRYEQAIADFTAAVEAYNRYAEAYGNRARAQWLAGNFEAALGDYSQAVVLAPGDYEPLNDLAWFLATCREDKFRDAEKAVSTAKTATDMAEGKSWNVLDTYAAALAEAGRFKDAVSWARKARDLAPRSERERIEVHLASYRSGKALRE